MCAEACRVVLLSPLDIHFSQTRIRPDFQDGRSLEDTQANIQVTDLKAVQEFEDLSESELPGELLLVAPFPSIEVTKWRCKFRDENGAPRLDPDTGLDLYSKEESWFSFDNRRLCCLQRAAVAKWPLQARCEVVEVPHNLARTRELRKFDTRTFGKTVLVGSRDMPDPACWSWRAAVGQPEEPPPDTGVAMQPGVRWRGMRAGAPGSGRGGAEGGPGHQLSGRRLSMKNREERRRWSRKNHERMRKTKAVPSR
ncbi:unnamed protein product [Polarella glacialis]|uniref:Uncharacterized protein n=1 Tax=Polarella glacialis TaxID=89957 RepID=A0A813IGP2_POLGL|nr:unnamed protein product [Polarella glacialis]